MHKFSIGDTMMCHEYCSQYILEHQQEMNESTSSEAFVNKEVIKPKFKAGDVVEDTYDVGQSLSYPVYVIKESIAINNGDTFVGYKYNVAPIDSLDESIIVNEDALHFWYSDANLEKYFKESTHQNGLPAWRGELYNFFMFFRKADRISLEPDAAVNEHEMEEFKDHTIPPIRMQHILRSHSIFARVYDVIKPAENKKIIANKINIDIVDVKDFASDFNDKIKSRNATNATYGKKLRDETIPDFTNEEKYLLI